MILNYEQQSVCYFHTRRLWHHRFCDAGGGTGSRAGATAEGATRDSTYHPAPRTDARIYYLRLGTGDGHGDGVSQCPSPQAVNGRNWRTTNGKNHAG